MRGPMARRRDERKVIFVYGVRGGEGEYTSVRRELTRSLSELYKAFPIRS